MTLSRALRQDWLNCQKPMMMYDPIAKIEAPAASPSSPSVRFTALVVLTVISEIQSRTAIVPSVTPKTLSRLGVTSRMNEIEVDAGRSPFESVSVIANQPNTADTRIVKMILYQPA